MLFKPKFVYHKKLESHVWDSNDHMRPDVRAAILNFMNLFFADMHRLNIPFDMSDVRDVLIHGSMTNYYYNKASDMDICIVCDFTRILRALPNINAIALLKDVVKALVVRMGVKIRGRKIDVEFVDVCRPQWAPGYYKVGGAYSVTKDAWVRKSIKLSGPEIKQIRRQAIEIYKREIKRLVNTLYNNNDPRLIDLYVDDIRNLRDTDHKTNYAQPINATTVAVRMIRSATIFNLARERALKLRAKQQSGKIS